jgi:hypothetical protein
MKHDTPAASQRCHVRLSQIRSSYAGVSLNSRNHTLQDDDGTYLCSTSACEGLGQDNPGVYKAYVPSGKGIGKNDVGRHRVDVGFTNLRLKTNHLAGWRAVSVLDHETALVYEGPNHTYNQTST